MYDRAYGVATYVRSDIGNALLVTTPNENDIRIGEMIVVKIYKPSATIWSPEKYSTDDNNREALINWTEEQNTYLVFGAEDRGTFTSAAWRRDYNPDLCFVSKNTNAKPLTASRSVFSDFPQHRPVVINIGISIPIIGSCPQPRWSLRRANWATFSEQQDNILSRVPQPLKTARDL
ncbi:hypothetical protein JTB14_013287 [Gonioctena quinquepunctata]|nr:hypothetical protein JTB14_013287 [Gonioctena quinquepunctata]